MALYGSAASDEALAAALAKATQLFAADASAEEGRSGEGIRPPRGDLYRPQVLNKDHRAIMVILGD